MNKDKAELYQRAIAGDLQSIIQWEYENCYQHLPASEVQAILDLASGTGDTTKAVLRAIGCEAIANYG